MSWPFSLPGICLLRTHSVPIRQGRLCGVGVGAEALGWPVGGSFCLTKDLIILLGIKSKPCSSIALS